MNDSAKGDSAALRALGGKLAPPKLGPDLRKLRDFSSEAKREIWNALGPSLDEPMTAAAEVALSEYCRRHALDDVVLAAVISAARFLVRESARQRLSQSDFEDDVRDLSKDSGVVQALGVGYRKALAHLSAGFAARSVAAHGRVLRQIDWRLERVVASSEARVLDVPVARITLTTDGPEGVSSVSLQLDLTTVQKLREACEAIEANAPRPPVRKAR